MGSSGRHGELVARDRGAERTLPGLAAEGSDSESGVPQVGWHPPLRLSPGSSVQRLEKVGHLLCLIPN